MNQPRAVSAEYEAAYRAFNEAHKARSNAVPGWRPHVFMLAPDEQQIVEFYGYDEAVAWMRWHLIYLEEMPVDQRPVR